MNWDEFTKTMLSGLLNKYSKERWALFLACFVSCLWLYADSLIAGNFGKLGADPDDTMRFVQIRDWMNGQSWFNTDQYRLGLAGGTDMHWSRLPDIPIAILASFFELFTSRENAIHLAAAVWPPLLAIPFLAMIYKGVKFLFVGPPRLSAILAALGLGALFLIQNPRFAPGALDHHNVQILFTLLTLVALLNSGSLKWGIVAGVSAAFAISIGPEIYPFIVVIVGFVALDWVYLGEKRRSRTLGFAGAFSVSILSLFVLTISPSGWKTIYCDQLSLVHLIGAITAGFGLFLLAGVISKRKLWVRASLLAALGLVTLMILGTTAPQCLGNPLSDLPVSVQKYWLEGITEAKPIFEQTNPLLAGVPYLIGTAILACLVLIFRQLRVGITSQSVLILLLLVTSLGFTIYQVRFFIFAQLFPILPLALWISDRHAAKLKNSKDLTYLLAILASIPFVLALPGLLLTADSEAESKENPFVETCVDLDDQVMATVNALPNGVLLAAPSAGSNLLKNSDHQIIAGNYHRNIKGIKLQLDIYAAEFDEAKALLNQNDIDYVMICKYSSLRNHYEKDFPNGFLTQFLTQERPKWLIPVEENWDKDGLWLFKVKD